MATYTQAIWKDAFCTLASNVSTGVSFRIQVYENGNYITIFSGTCWPRPGSTDAIVRLNDICANYLTRAWPSAAQDDWYEATFQVQAYLAATWTTIDTVTFTRDWSYDSAFTPGTDIPVDPVLDILNPLQYLPIFSENGTFSATIKGGDFNIDFNDDFFSENWYLNYSRNGYTYLLDLNDYPGWYEITANGKTYRAADMCGGFVLYYINSFGGWDTLPVQGRTVLTDAITHYTKDMVYDNRAYTARGTENYINEIAHKYVLNVGPLTSEQSARMHNLMGSTYVYLHDIVAGRIHPVVLTATSAERKTRAGVLHTYQVEATLAQDRTRR